MQPGGFDPKPRELSTARYFKSAVPTPSLGTLPPIRIFFDAMPTVDFVELRVCPRGETPLDKPKPPRNRRGFDVKGVFLRQVERRPPRFGHRSAIPSGTPVKVEKDFCNGRETVFPEDGMRKCQWFLKAMATVPRPPATARTE